MKYLLLFAVFGIISAQTTTDAVFKKDVVALARNLRSCVEDTEKDPPVITEGKPYHDRFDAQALWVSNGLVERGYKKESELIHFLTEIRGCLSPTVTHTAIPMLDRVAGYL